MAFEVTDALWEMPGFLVAVNRPNSVHRLLLCNCIAQSFHGNCSGKVYDRDNHTSRICFFFHTLLQMWAEKLFIPSTNNSSVVIYLTIYLYNIYKSRVCPCGLFLCTLI